MVNKRIPFTVGGILSCSIGMDIWINQKSWLYHQPVSKIAGLVLIFFGLVMIVTGLFRSKSFKRTKYICPKCEGVVSGPENEDLNCSSCNIDMEPLAGYYVYQPKLPRMNIGIYSDKSTQKIKIKEQTKPA